MNRIFRKHLSLKTLFHLPSRTFSSHPTPLQDAGPISSLLKTRAVIRFRGPDSLKFLQGLLTNDLRRFGEKFSTIPTPNVPFKSAPPVYAAMLTPQGKFLYDFFVYKPPRPDERLDVPGSGPGAEPDEVGLYADVDASVLDELLHTMKKYRLRSKVDIDSMADEFSCWQRYGHNLVEKPEASSVGWGGTVDQSGISASQGNDVGWQWYIDPRLDCLGFRGIFSSDSIPPLVEADKEADERNYLMWRLENGVAEGSNEIPKAMPLEYNFVGLNTISFDKGCYVGQELIARTHHRGVIRKRLLPLKFIDDDRKDVERKVSPGSEVINSSTGKKVGLVTTALGSRGLGLVRLEEAFKSKGSLAIKGDQDLKVEAIRPKWWPSEWLLE